MKLIDLQRTKCKSVLSINFPSQTNRRFSMNTSFNQRILVICCLVTFGLLAFTTPETVKGQGSNIIQACAKNDGSLRLVSTADQCKNNETPISWNGLGNSTSSNVTAITHIPTATNRCGAYTPSSGGIGYRFTVIDNPLLNNKPEAIILAGMYSIPIPIFSTGSSRMQGVLANGGFAYFANEADRTAYSFGYGNLSDCPTNRWMVPWDNIFPDAKLSITIKNP